MAPEPPSSREMPICCFGLIAAPRLHDSGCLGGGGPLDLGEVTRLLVEGVRALLSRVRL